MENSIRFPLSTRGPNYRLLTQISVIYQSTIFLSRSIHPSSTLHHKHIDSLLHLHPPYQHPTQSLQQTHPKCTVKLLKILLHPILFIHRIALLLFLTLIIPEKLLTALRSFRRFVLLTERARRGRKLGFSS